MPPRSAPDDTVSLDGLDEWRQRILSVLVLAMAVLGAFAYVPSMVLSIESRHWSIAIADTVAYGWMIWIAARRRASVRSRGIQLVGLCYVLATTLLVVLGPMGAGLYWLGAATTMASLLLGRRAALVAIVVDLVVLVAIAVGIHAELWPWLAHVPSASALWLVLAANSLFIDAAMALSISALLRGLESSIARRREAEDRMREAQRLEAIGTLAGGIAHELNNMLVPILADAEAISAAGTTRGEAERITQAALRARDLVRRIQVFGRREEPERRPLPICKVLREAVELLRASLPAGIELRVRIDIGDVAVVANETEIHQVVMNLGTNAKQAMDEGGMLSIDAVPVDGGARVRVCVRDTGVGMDEHTCAHAFDPFFTTKAPGIGTGLGLSTVHGIATALGGTATLSSELGVGTEVVVELPTSGEIVQRATPPAPAGARAGERVLVVDDEAVVLEAHGRVLRRLGYEVVVAGSGEDALDVLAKAPLAVDLVVTDLRMPSLGGLDLVARARAKWPALPVVLVTGFLDDDERARAEAHRGVTILLKPFSSRELAEAIRQSLPSDGES